MRVLVTGGAGFIGSHLCEALVRQGNQVFVLDDLSTGRFENIEHIPALTCVIDSTLNQEIVRDLLRLTGQENAVQEEAAAPQMTATPRRHSERKTSAPVAIPHDPHFAH